MFTMNGFKATLIQNNRNESSVYDDQDKQEIEIKVCPYNVDESVSFGEYTTAQATGYFIVKSNVDVREGDEIVINNRTFSIIDLKDNWIWNKVANIILAVK